MTKKEISAGIIIFRRTIEGPKFLLLYHGHNYWNFAKGKIEKEEGSLAAALREVREETGLTGQDLRPMKDFKAYEKFFFKRQDQQIFKVVIFYLAETRTVDIKVSSEHEGYGWFLIRDAKNILGRYKDSQRVFKLAYEFLQAKVRKPAVS